MQRRTFGGTGRPVSIIGQGTWMIDGSDWAAPIVALRQGLDLGMTHVDTAEMYGDAEELVAEAIVGRRDEVFLASKVLPSNASRAGVRAACERSLKRLRTDRLDCYLLHWPGSYPLAETVAGFEDMRHEGKILSWGVSNFDENDLEELLPLATEGGPVCNQVLYHLQERAIEYAVLPWCERHGIALVGYSPFGHGNFPGPKSAGGKVLAEIAAARAATPRQVALAFLTRNAELFTIPKASSAAHAAENAGAGDLVLSPEDIVKIDRAFPRGQRPRTLPML
jgi:diketogulonate reductase-like aldo/keto reductase